MSLYSRLAVISKKIRSFSFENYLQYATTDALLIKYWDGEQNWGDSVNPYLLSAIAGKPVINSGTIFNVLDKEVILGVGSIISGDLRNHVIWGSGFISERSRLSEFPSRVLALRGKGSWNKLRQLGLDPPRVFGDPVLLFPDLFCPAVEKKYELGIIPHFKEMQLPVVSELTRRFGDEVRLIDMTGDLFKVVEDILSCRRIFSSSLHGLVLADAYEIPSCRLILSDLIIGGNFKYDDYYSGIGISDYPRYQMTTVPKSVKELYSMPICHRKSFDGDLLKQVLTEYVNA